MANMRVALRIDRGVQMYLVVIDQMLLNYAEIFKARTTERFESIVQELVMDHVAYGKEPPDEVFTAVVNIADDMMAGRDVTIRSGDYISLMTYARENKML